MKKFLQLISIFIAGALIIIATAWVAESIKKDETFVCSMTFTPKSDEYIEIVRQRTPQENYFIADAYLQEIECTKQYRD